VILTHEGIVAEVAYEEGDDLMHGSTVNTRAVLHFAGKDIGELKAAFPDTIADYRDWPGARRRARNPSGQSPLGQYRPRATSPPRGEGRARRRKHRPIDS
jgi:hypothetical protein